MSKVLEVNVSKGTQTEREMNDVELRDLAERQARNAARIEAEAKAAEARLSALSKLAALGLTDAEITALLGV